MFHLSWVISQPEGDLLVAGEPFADLPDRVPVDVDRDVERAAHDRDLSPSGDVHDRDAEVFDRRIVVEMPRLSGSVAELPPQPASADAVARASHFRVNIMQPPGQERAANHVSWAG